MAQKLLTEYAPMNYSRDAITEAISNNQPVVLRNVVLQRANVKNQNGRIYPLEILMRESKKFQTLIDERRALGETDHPESPVVNLKNVSHHVTKMWWNGTDLMGDIEVLSTPCGNILKELLKNDIRLGISSRGLGSVKELEEGAVEVAEDFNLICFDVVSNPSTKGAFLTENIDVARNPWSRIDLLIYDFLQELK